MQISSGPQKMKIGCRVVNAMRTIALSVGRHLSGGPSGVFSQSRARMRAAISPSPARKDAEEPEADDDKAFSGVDWALSSRARKSITRTPGLYLPPGGFPIRCRPLHNPQPRLRSERLV